MREVRYSVPAALNRGLQRGLPIAAILAATVPVWGMSWYFDTENWAAGMWNSWAESRTDTWREAMVRAVLVAGGWERRGRRASPLTPPGVGSGDFSFVVIGDTGEGDASQHVLRDQLLTVANSPDVRFVVISSDVVYPTGAMRDYEAKFWLPFKGVTRPVYAIPGNHDWYDALEELRRHVLPAGRRAREHPRAGRVRSARDEHDRRPDRRPHSAKRHGCAASTACRPAFSARRSSRCRRTDSRSLAIDTGVLRQIDPRAGALARRRAASVPRGKTTMAIVGHPFLCRRPRRHASATTSSRG